MVAPSIGYTTSYHSAILELEGELLFGNINSNFRDTLANQKASFRSSGLWHIDVPLAAAPIFVPSLGL